MTPLLLILCLLNPDGAANDLADDWRYPGTHSGASGGTQHTNQRLGSYSCQDIEDPFPDVLRWYADRAAAPDLIRRYEEFADRAPDAALQSCGSIADLDSDGETATLGTIVYAFTDERQHVTLMPASDRNGQRVVVSIAAAHGHTTVQIITATD